MDTFGADCSFTITNGPQTVQTAVSGGPIDSREAFRKSLDAIHAKMAGITEAEVYQAFGPDDFEPGDEPVEVERNPHPGMVVSVRFDHETTKRLLEWSKYDGQTVTDWVRDAVENRLRRLG